jgi:hypothetical protein
LTERRGDYEGLVAVRRVTGPNEDCRGFIMDARLMPPTAEGISIE